MTDCLYHIDYAESVCPECEQEVDRHGNTEGQPIDYCAFPDCGCDGSRLCMAKHGPSSCACAMNFEQGSWPAVRP